VTRILPLALALAALLVLPASAGTNNPWLTQRTFINMAHQGGEDEFPSNTMYAYKQALAAGADTLELDVNRTKDDQFVVMHDWKVDRTTNGTGYTTEQTLADIQQLDAAYNFIPGRNAVSGEPDSAYPFRGVRTGAKPAPLGFKPDDFRPPSLTEVLAEFPRTPINIEIKGQEDQESEFIRNAELLAEQLKGTTHESLIVVSFNQAAVDRFHELAPDIGIAPGLAGLVGHFLNGEPMPNADAVVAIQIPTEYAGIEALTPERVVQAHREGWAVHVWLSGNQENARVYNDLLDQCVDGIMPARPKALEKVLRRRDVVRPGGEGTDPCSARATGATLRAGRARAQLVRRGVEPLAYTGTVVLRSRQGAKLASGRFKLGKDAKKGRAKLRMTKAGRRVAAAGRPSRGVVLVRTKGKRGEPVQTKVRLRP
jgi:glycerophosphoryl diester phosphodiesterase